MPPPGPIYINVVVVVAFKAKVDEDGDVRDIKIPEFHGRSYLELPLRRRVGKTSEFEIWILPKQPDGWLAVCSQSNFIIILFGVYNPEGFKNYVTQCKEAEMAVCRSKIALNRCIRTDGFRDYY